MGELNKQGLATRLRKVAQRLEDQDVVRMKLSELLKAAGRERRSPAFEDAVDECLDGLGLTVKPVISEIAPGDLDATLQFFQRG